MNPNTIHEQREEETPANSKQHSINPSLSIPQPMTQTITVKGHTHHQQNINQQPQQPQQKHIHHHHHNQVKGQPISQQIVLNRPGPFQPPVQQLQQQQPQQSQSRHHNHHHHHNQPKQQQQVNNSQRAQTPTGRNQVGNHFLQPQHTGSRVVLVSPSSSVRGGQHFLQATPAGVPAGKAVQSRSYSVQSLSRTSNQQQQQQVIFGQQQQQKFSQSNVSSMPMNRTVQSGFHPIPQSMVPRQNQTQQFANTQYAPQRLVLKSPEIQVDQQLQQQQQKQNKNAPSHILNLSRSKAHKTQAQTIQQQQQQTQVQSRHHQNGQQLDLGRSNRHQQIQQNGRLVSQSPLQAPVVNFGQKSVQQPQSILKNGATTRNPSNQAPLQQQQQSVIRPAQQRSVSRDGALQQPKFQQQQQQIFIASPLKQTRTGEIQAQQLQASNNNSQSVNRSKQVGFNPTDSVIRQPQQQQMVTSHIRGSSANNVAVSRYVQQQPQPQQQQQQSQQLQGSKSRQQPQHVLNFRSSQHPQQQQKKKPENLGKVENEFLSFLDTLI